MNTPIQSVALNSMQSIRENRVENVFKKLEPEDLVLNLKSLRTKHRMDRLDRMRFSIIGEEEIVESLICL